MSGDEVSVNVEIMATLIFRRALCYGISALCYGALCYSTLYYSALCYGALCYSALCYGISALGCQHEL
jgi:hypothetical protein